MANQQTAFRTCNLCEAMCGLAITIEDDQIISIKGDEQDVFSNGYLCPKAIALQDIQSDPDRLTHPLEKQADGTWRELGWDEAFDKTVQAIQRIQQHHGNDAVGVYLGNPNVHNLGFSLFGPLFLRSLRTRNKYSATSVDQLPHHIVSSKMFGHQLQIPVPDLDNCDHFVMLGANPMASNGSIMSAANVKQRLKALTERGQLVVIDPRRSETAKIANQHYFIKPGTDTLLMLSLLHHLFKSGRADSGRLAAHIKDDNSLQSLLEPYDASRVAPLIGIEAEQILALLADFLDAKNPVIYGRMGCSVQEFGLLTQYLIMLFNLFTGRLDAAGGLMFTKPAVNLLDRTTTGKFNRSQSRLRQLPSFASEFPVATLAEEITTAGAGQIKAMVLAAGNPVLSTPNGKQLDRAFKQLDFMVAVDFYLTESTRHADIILPPVSPLEREHYDLIFNSLAIRNTANYSPALLQNTTTGKQDWEIYLALASRLNPPQTWVEKLGLRRMMKKGPAGMLDKLLKAGPYELSVKKLLANPHGVDLGALQPCLPEALYHKDKKIHLDCDFFMADLQRVEARFFGNDNTQHDNFVLIGRRHLRSNNSWLHNNKRLTKGKPRCTAQMATADATRLGINAGELVRIQSRVGQIQIPVELSDDIMPGVISVPHGWGHHGEQTAWKIAEANPGVSVNDLTDELFIDELSGNAALNGVPIQVTAIT